MKAPLKRTSMKYRTNEIIVLSILILIFVGCMLYSKPLNYYEGLVVNNENYVSVGKKQIEERMKKESQGMRDIVDKVLKPDSKLSESDINKVLYDLIGIGEKLQHLDTQKNILDEIKRIEPEKSCITKGTERERLICNLRDKLRENITDITGQISTNGINTDNGVNELMTIYKTDKALEFIRENYENDNVPP